MGIVGNLAKHQRGSSALVRYTQRWHDDESDQSCADREYVVDDGLGRFLTHLWGAKQRQQDLLLGSQLKWPVGRWYDDESDQPCADRVFVAVDCGLGRFVTHLWDAKQWQGFVLGRQHVRSIG